MKSHIKVRKGRGRPLTLTDDLQERICKALQAGAYMETAAAYSGVPKSTFYSWMNRGNEQKTGRFRDFLDAIEKAMAEAEMRDLLGIEQAARGTEAVLNAKGEVIRPAMKPDWYARAWRLERKFPKKWGRKQMVKLDQFDESDGKAFDGENFHDALINIIRKAESE